MFGLIFFAMFMIGLAGYFWYLEIIPWIDALEQPKKRSWLILILLERLRVTIINIGRLFTVGKYLLIDIGITLASASMLGFGAGVAGGVIGLTMSNAISVLILIIMKKRKV